MCSVDVPSSFIIPQMLRAPQGINELARAKADQGFLLEELCAHSYGITQSILAEAFCQGL